MTTIKLNNTITQIGDTSYKRPELTIDEIYSTTKEEDLTLEQKAWNACQKPQLILAERKRIIYVKETINAVYHYFKNFDGVNVEDIKFSISDYLKGGNEYSHMYFYNTIEDAYYQIGEGRKSCFPCNLKLGPIEIHKNSYIELSRDTFEGNILYKSNSDEECWPSDRKIRPYSVVKFKKKDYNSWLKVMTTKAKMKYGYPEVVYKNIMHLSGYVFNFDYDLKDFNNN